MDGPEMRNPVPDTRPKESVDLMTAEGAALAKAQRHYSDTRIVEIDCKAPGADGQPTGRPVKTYDYTPHAGKADFDDSAWETISPMSLTERRGNREGRQPDSLPMGTRVN